MNAPRHVVLLGATGSIGQSTLAVIRRHPEQFRLAGMAARRNRAALQALSREFDGSRACLFEESGMEGLVELATLPEADVVVVATTGTTGILPTIAALEAGKTVALANKEALVYAGQFVMAAARHGAGTLLPADSEHNAIFQCLDGMRDPRHLERIILTASGGPFLHHTRTELAAVTVGQALKHPNWEMGDKVTLDSATLANKGLEIIEAHWLFNLPADSIEVVIHPQSLIHSMVEFRDGSLLAQLAPASMTFPLQHALTYPDKLEPTVSRLDLGLIRQLELRPPDTDKFPCLRLAREALEAGGMAPAVYNTANEVAGQAFLEKSIPFLAIPKLIEHCMIRLELADPSSLEELLGREAEIRAFARKAAGNQAADPFL